MAGLAVCVTAGNLVIWLTSETGFTVLSVCCSRGCKERMASFSTICTACPLLRVPDDGILHYEDSLALTTKLQLRVVMAAPSETESLQYQYPKRHCVSTLSREQLIRCEQLLLFGHFVSLLLLESTH